MEPEKEKTPFDEKNLKNESKKSDEALNDDYADDLLSTDEFPIFISLPYNSDPSPSPSPESLSRASTPDSSKSTLPTYLKDLYAATRPLPRPSINFMDISSPTLDVPYHHQQYTQSNHREELDHSSILSQPRSSLAKNFSRDPSLKLKTHQLQHLYDEVIPFLLNELDINSLHILLDSNSKTSSEDIVVLEKIIQRLESNFYKKARECIADIDKMFLQFYLRRHGFIVNNWITSVCSAQEEFHKLIAKMEWKREKSDRTMSTLEDESPYFNESMMEKPPAGRFEPQLKYLHDVVIPNLLAQPYGFLLQRSEATDGSEAAGSSSSPDSMSYQGNALTTLEIIQERLGNFYYLDAEECIHDVDEFFMDCYVHKFTGEEFMPMIAWLQEYFHRKIITMPEDFDSIETAVMNENDNGIIERKVFCPVKFFRDFVMDSIWKHEYAMPFQSSNDLKEYLKILMPKDFNDGTVEEELMNLGKIKKRLDNNEYKTINQCVQDFDVMFHKILQPELRGQSIYVQAQELKKMFEEQIQNLPWL